MNIFYDTFPKYKSTHESETAHVVKFIFVLFLKGGYLYFHLERAGITIIMRSSRQLDKDLNGGK